MGPGVIIAEKSVDFCWSKMEKYEGSKLVRLRFQADWLGRSTDCRFRQAVCRSDGVWVVLCC